MTYLAETLTPLPFPLIGVIGAAIHSRSKRTGLPKTEIWFRWWTIAALGGGSLWMTLFFIFVPDFLSEKIGFTESPFATEIAFANLALVFVALRSIKASYRERLTIGFGAGVFLWGATLGHVNQWLVNGNSASGNVGGVLFYDTLIPLLILLFARLANRDNVATEVNKIAVKV